MNNPYAPSYYEMIETCKKLANEDEILEYLSECFSYEYQCPDKCDNAAMDFLNDYEDEIFT